MYSGVGISKPIMLVIPITTAILGTWQMFRLYYKKELIKSMEERTTRETITIPLDIEEKVSELLYTKVRVHGKFNHSREMHLFPRQFNTENILVPQFKDRQPGVQIITPLYCEELESYILVNRGWVPHVLIDSSSRTLGQVNDRVEICGLVRESLKSWLYTGKNNPEKNHWQWLDLSAMAEFGGTRPIMIDSDYNSTIPGGPVGGQTRITLVNKHKEYIFTWYVLSLLTGYLVYKMYKNSTFSTVRNMLSSRPPIRHRDNR